MGEKAKRLAPSSETLRQLFLHSGNLCAFPDCTHLMMDSGGVFIGQICHIEAAEEGGERFNPDMSNEDRRHFNNLMLMCYAHHHTTNDVEKFTVKKLRKIKSDHEKRFSNPERAILERITDWTERLSSTEPKNLKRINRVLEWNLADDELSESLDELKNYLIKFRKVPVELRRFLAAVAKRTWKMRDENVVHDREKSIAILCSDIEQAHRMSKRLIANRISAFEAYGLMHLDEIYTGLRPESALAIPKLRSGWPLWDDIVQFCERESVPIEVFSEDIDFARLDD